ncbi:MAG: TonB-dependent receptor [bacterium]|nr:TonB-dependent receptor [bacterium]
MKSGYIKYLILFLLLCKAAAGQDTDTSRFVTETIKIFGNKIVTNIFDSPVKIQVIGKNKIKNKNGEYLSDILQLTGGAFIKSYGGNGSLNTISMNGLGAEHTLVLLNGVKLNSTQNNQIDLNTISKDNIESIEILNNGSSSVYGSEAIGGVINIITTGNSSGKLNLKLNGQAGSYNQKKLSASLKKNAGPLNLSFDYSTERSPNNYDYYFNNGIRKLLKDRQNSNYDFTNYSMNIGLNSGMDARINLYSSYSDQMRNFPGIETGSEASRSTQKDRNWISSLSFEKKFNKVIRLTTQINFQNNLSKYNDKVLTDSYYKNLYYSNSTQVNYINKNIQLVTGFDLSYARLYSNEVDGGVKRWQPGIYAASEIDMSEKLKIFPSVRYDYISDINKSAVSGKLGINFKPFKKTNLNFKTSAGNNFASPTFNELYWNDLGNRSLSPESSVNIDFGAIASFETISQNVLEVTYTYIEAKDKIVWSPNSNGLWTPKNILRSVSNVIGVSFDSKKIIARDLMIDIGASYSFTTSLRKNEAYAGDPTYDKQIFYIPEHLAKINLGLTYKTTGINLFYNYTGKRFTDFDNKNSLPGVNLLEGNIYQDVKIWKLNTQMKFEVNNIFNEDYQMISGYPMPLRNFKVSVGVSYQ